MIAPGELSLEIKTLNSAQIEINIEYLEETVDNRMKDYEAAKYIGNADAAKRDRAQLNKAADQVADARKTIRDILLAPFADIEVRLKALEKKIKAGSDKLDNIVKSVEEAEYSEKLAKIHAVYLGQDFPLVSFDKFIQPNWRNKGTKIADAIVQMTDKIREIRNNLVMLEAFPEPEMIQALYLENLDMASAVARGKSIKDSRERLAAEVAKAPAVEKMAQADEEYNEEQHKSPAEMAAEAAAVEPDLLTYTMKFTGTRQALFELKEFMKSHNITYEKI